MRKPVRVAVIGVGGIGRSHMAGWLNTDYAECVAGADINPSVLAEWGAKHNITKLSTDPADLFRDPNIDAVDLCIPNMHHAPLAIAALNAGKHVLCEKPLAPTPDLVRQMIEARDRNNKLLMTAQHFRFAGTAQATKREIETGALGDIYHARSWMLRRSGMIPLPTFTTKALSGGGPCIDIGVHVLDLTLWLMGHPKPAAVSGVAKTMFGHREGIWSQWRPNMPMPKQFDVEDFAAAFVRFENGATLMLEVAWWMHHDNLDEDIQIWLYGTDGGAHWPSCQFLSTNYQSRQFLNTTLKATADKMEPHALECVEFARAIAENLPSPVPAEESLQVMAILDAIYQSQRENREVRVVL